MKFSRAAIAAYVGMVFASGAILGVFGQRLWEASRVAAQPPTSRRPDPEVVRKRIVDMYHDRLHLTEQQMTQLNAIMDEARQRVDDTRHKMGPEYQKIREEQNAKFRQILTPDQQVEFDKILKEREERRKQNAAKGIQRVN
jgi:Spy/CpxP family protein refolding chaperone